MDDFTLLKDMADRTPLPTSADLAPARARLTAAFTRQDEQMITSTEPTRLTPGKPRRRRRLVVSTVAVFGLAAAITGVVALGGLEQVGVAPPKANAAEILHQAADAVRELPATPPRPDQFIYTRTQGGDQAFRESWLSADGTHDGLIVQRGERIPLPGCRDGQRAVVFASEVVPGKFEPCEPEPAYRSDLPTDAAAMREFLEQDGEDANKVGKNILHYFAETYVSPESLAALFEALAGYPGLTVVEHATDSAGRPGIGVSWSSPGQGGEIIMTLVFDRETHAFLGTSDWDAIVAQGIVATVGQQP
jgi:hypothetical protein